MMPGGGHEPITCRQSVRSMVRPRARGRALAELKQRHEAEFEQLMADHLDAAVLEQEAYDASVRACRAKRSEDCECGYFSWADFEATRRSPLNT